MKHARAVSVVVVLSSIAGLEAPVYAQWDPAAAASLGRMMGQTSPAIGNLSLGRAASQQQSHPDAGPGQAHSITFIASPAVAAAFRAHVIETVIRQDPAHAVQLRSVLDQIAYQTVMAQNAATAARTDGNTAALASLQHRLIDRFHASHVDLTALRLTDQGFVPR
jgi:hypothetical protein